MNKTLIICGTNRPNARTRIISKYVYDYVIEKGNASCEYYDLKELPENLASQSMYDGKNLPDDLIAFQDDKLIPADRIILISPEYNGGLAGILKLFIDAISGRKLGPSLHFKKVLLIGVADGRAGNLRGMEYLTGILNHMKVVVYPIKLPISKINSLLDESKEQLTDESTQKAIKSLVDDFIEWEL